jgi:hypothetical protein
MSAGHRTAACAFVQFRSARGESDPGLSLVDAELPEVVLLFGFELSDVFELLELVVVELFIDELDDGAVLLSLIDELDEGVVDEPVPAG